MNKIAVLIVLGVIALAGLILVGYKEFSSNDEHKVKRVEYEIINEWRLPEELDEISGIGWIDDNRLACIQDEDGIIFIFNLKTSKIEQRIDFGGPGDYEDIQLVGEDAYVLRSDGEIFEVGNYLSPNPVVKTYSNSLTAKQNMESLSWDKKNNRLLLAVKDREPGDDTFKGVYQFSLDTKELLEEPIFRLSMEDGILKDRDVKPKKKLQPSALARHPGNNSFYILDGRAPQLIIADNEMKFKKRYELSKKKFRQAEGITFSINGQLFISNEVKGGKANILEVVFN